MHETIFSPSWGGGAGGGGLINMNGRLYDPLLARMLSPDNYVQDATSTQAFNRYSYCWNNPLKFTDPSGDFLTWNVRKDGFSIGVNFSVIGIPLGFGVNVGSTTGVYGEVGYRVGGTGFGAGAAAQQSVGWNFAGGSWSTTTSVNAYASFGVFNAGASASATHDITYGGWNFDWNISSGVGIGKGNWGIGAFVNYGSNGWSYGLGGYYQSKRPGTVPPPDDDVYHLKKEPIPVPPHEDPTLYLEKMQAMDVPARRNSRTIPMEFDNEGIRIIRRTAPEYNSGVLSQSKTMDVAQQWLQPGYEDMGKGRFVSKDGMRQVRFGAHELNSSQMHIHFEAYKTSYWNGGRIIENSRIIITK
jgi:RHS repeat-associated protein